MQFEAATAAAEERQPAVGLGALLELVGLLLGDRACCDGGVEAGVVGTEQCLLQLLRCHVEPLRDVIQERLVVVPEPEPAGGSAAPAPTTSASSAMPTASPFRLRPITELSSRRFSTIDCSTQS